MKEREKEFKKDIPSLNGEKWLPVEGFEGEYEVSNLGRVKSLGRFKVTKKGMHYPVKPLLLKPRNYNGYLSVGFPKDGKYKMLRVNRLVAAAFVDNPDGKPFVNHIDGNKTNNHASNLEWVTAKENSQHAMRTGLRKAGREVIREDGMLFPSIRAAAKHAGITISTMRYHIIKGTPDTRDGLIYRFADEGDKQDESKDQTN